MDRFRIATPVRPKTQQLPGRIHIQRGLVLRRGVTDNWGQRLCLCGKEQCLENISNDFAGLSGRENVCGDIAGNDAPGPDYKAVNDSNAGTDDSSAAEPNV